jgi:CysZ protein
MSELARGVGDLGRGLAFLRKHPRLWGWVIAPAIATLVLLIGIIFGVTRLASPLVERATSALPSLVQGVAGSLLWIIVVIGLAIGAYLVFVALVGVIAGPFCELLSEAVEQRLTGQPGPPFALGRFLREAAIGLAHGVRRLVVAIVGFLLLFALSFIPVIGTIAAMVIGGWLAARAAAYDAYDGVLARRGMAYRDKLAYLRANRSRTLGLGAAVAGMLLVPGLNLIALGVGATGATLAAHELAKRPRG